VSLFSNISCSTYHLEDKKFQYIFLEHTVTTSLGRGVKVRSYETDWRKQVFLPFSNVNYYTEILPRDRNIWRVTGGYKTVSFQPLGCHFTIFLQIYGMVKRFKIATFFRCYLDLFVVKPFSSDEVLTTESRHN